MRERPPRVLVVDDSSIVLELMLLAFEQKGIEAKGASTLEEFRTLLRKWSPDLVLTDVRMPEIDGAKLTEEIKSQVTTKTIPVVLFSSRSITELEMLRAIVGADFAVSKDEGVERVASFVSEILETRGSEATPR